MDITVVIPARDEADCITETLSDLHRVLTAGHVKYTLLVVDDHSTDDTFNVAASQALMVRNRFAPGYGNAVMYGLFRARYLMPVSTWLTVMTADGSDSPADLLTMLRVATYEAQSWDIKAVFGTRFDQRATVIGYPPFKRVFNRLGNHLAARLVGTPYTDLTNPFKLYRTDAVTELLPFLEAKDFSLGLELAVRFLRRYPNDFVVTSTDWRDRTAGRSKFKLKHAFGFLRRLHALGLL